MKKLLLLSIGAAFAGTIAAQSLPNGGFENWNNASWMDPMYYNSSNDQDIPKGGAANVTQVAGVASTFTVQYGVQATTISNVVDGDEGGYFINADVNGNGGPTGGIQTGWTSKPTGIRFYYQYTPVSNDTAAVIVFFKYEGAIEDTFLITLPTAASSYTLHSYYKNISNMAFVPDTVIFGALSSIKILQNNGGGNSLPVGSTLTIDSVTFTGVSSQPAELNGDFQQWVTNSELIPVGWYTNPNVTQSTDFYAGSYAMELETTSNTEDGLEPGQASTGYYSQHCNSNCTPFGEPYTPTGSGKDTLYFYYKYVPQPNDTATVYLNFIKNGDGVFGSNIFMYGTTSTYTQAYIAFDLNGLSPMPDSVTVTVLSSSHAHDTTSSQYVPYIGTVLKVDNMYFGSQKSVDLGVNTLSATEGIRVYPNPAKNQINIDLSNLLGSLESIAMYDMSGRMLSTQNYAGGVRNTMETIDISGFSAGVYLIEATTTNGKFYQKVVKE